MKNKITLTSALGGVIVGILLATVWFTLNPVNKRSNDYMMSSESTMRHMPNGQMMENGSKMDMTMNTMMMGLSGKTGDDFDKAFLSEMIMHHEGAVAMAQMVLKTSKRPELISLANAVISAQTKEIEQMKNWQKKWFNQ